MRKAISANQQKIVERKKKRLLITFILFLIAFSSMLIALSLASFLPQLNIEGISVTGTDKLNPESISFPNFGSNGIKRDCTENSLIMRRHTSF